MGLYLLYLHSDSKRHSPKADCGLGFIQYCSFIVNFPRFGFDTSILKEAL